MPNLFKQHARKAERARAHPAGPEWVGGRRVAPVYVTEGEPYRPELIIWMELPSQVVVSVAAVDPKDPQSSLSAALAEALENPMVGPPRQPARVRVEDEATAGEVKQVLPGAQVVVSPTPELDQVIEAMEQSGAFTEGGEEPTYLGNGAISPELMEDLFISAGCLYQVAPWKQAAPHQVVRLDIPALGVEGVCLSVLGAMGDTRGLVFYPSLIAYENFLDAASTSPSSPAERDLGTDALALLYAQGSELPHAMLREVREHGWPITDPDGYPTVAHHDRDGTPRPLAEHDVRVVAACAAAFGAFFAKHRALFERESLEEPICESYADEDDLEVRFTVPYEAAELFDLEAPGTSAAPVEVTAPVAELASPPAGPKVGRNAPCPCGSGRKYKKCCLPKEAGAAPQAEGYQPVHRLDERLTDKLMNYGFDQFGPQWLTKAKGDFHRPDHAAELFPQWSIYHYTIGKQTVADRAASSRALRLSAEETTWFAAQRKAWLSLWEILEVDPGKSLFLKDLLTYETRHVAEKAASESLVKRDVVLARVVDHQGVSLLCGLYQQALPPEAADQVHQRVRKRLRLKRCVPVDRLRDEKIGRFMIRRWEEALAGLDERAKIPPRLQNTEGDELLLTTDHFDFTPSDRARIERSLAAVPGLEAGQGGEGEADFVFKRQTKGKPDQELVRGTVWLAEGRLRLETNSLERADELRRQLESAAGSLLRHRAREHADPRAMLRQGQPLQPPGTEPEQPPATAEMSALLLEMKARHYADWADHPLPAFGGKSAREMVGTKAGRERVRVMLKTFEHTEARAPEGQRFDFAPLRRELGLEE